MSENNIKLINGNLLRKFNIFNDNNKGSQNKYNNEGYILNKLNTKELKLKIKVEN